MVRRLRWSGAVFVMSYDNTILSSTPMLACGNVVLMLWFVYF